MITALPATTLRPGLLVSLKTTVRGNVSYAKQTIEADHATDNGARVARWETERTVTDPIEHDQAIQVRGQCRSLIMAVCSASAFGYLCPDDRADDLAKAIRAARDLAEQFNATAKITQINVYVIAGRVAQDDVEAIRAISSEMRDLMSAMETGINNLDVKLVRESATKAASIGQMLAPGALEKVKVAVDTARAAARKITRIAKAGETAAAEIDRAAIEAIAKQRTAFLDLDDMVKPTIEAPVAEGRAIDFDHAPAQPVQVPQHVPAQIEV